MKKRISIILLALLLTGCGSQNMTQSTNSQSEASSIASTVASQDKTHFTYDDQNDWYFESGDSQSPIDIVTENTIPEVTDNGDIIPFYNQSITKVENNGHSIQVSDGGTAQINGRPFELQQFHFHAESEHTINGKHYPIEAHFVHQAQDGRLAVVAVFFEEGNENKGFQEVIDDVKNDSSDPIEDVNEMLPKNMSYYHYLGSLTTPPLVENAEWYVLSTPVQVSAEQIATFQSYYSHNNREIQPLNDRKVVFYDAES